MVGAAERAMKSRVGFVIPSSNVRVEPMACELLNRSRRVTAHFARVPVESVDPGERSNAQFGLDRMLSAAECLIHSAVTAIAWAGTSGSWRGLDEDRRFTRAVTSTLGALATTSSLAVLKACEHLGVTKVGLATPFTDAIANDIVHNLGSDAVSIVREEHLGISGSLECSEVPAATIEAMIDRLAGPGVEAIVVLCTNFGLGSGSNSLEHLVGVPVIDSISATIWDTLSLAGEWRPIRGRGRLLASKGARTVVIPGGA